MVGFGYLFDLRLTEGIGKVTQLTQKWTYTPGKWTHTLGFKIIFYLAYLFDPGIIESIH